MQNQDIGTKQVVQMTGDPPQAGGEAPAGSGQQFPWTEDTTPAGPGSGSVRAGVALCSGITDSAALSPLLSL